MYQMPNYLIVLCLIFCFVKCHKISKETNDIWDAVADGHYQQCADEFGVEREIGRDFLRNLYLPDERPFHCFLKCLYDSVKFLNEDGDFEHAVVVEKAHFLTHELAERCITESHKQTEICMRAYVGASCAVAGLAEVEPHELTVRKSII